ncbi:MAG: hypothetical protein WAU91_18235, partial [Desulfatitalea sp.]
MHHNPRFVFKFAGENDQLLAAPERKSKKEQSRPTAVDPIACSQSALGNQAFMRMIGRGPIQAQRKVSQPDEPGERQAEQ